MLKRLTVAVAALSHARLLSVLDYDANTGIFRWKKSGRRAGCAHKGYIRIRVDGRAYLAHRLAWFFVKGTWPEEEIDHSNPSKSNNVFSNLREANRSQNQRNTVYCNNKIGLKGVCKEHRGNRYRAQISINGKCVRIGSFQTPQLAHEAYLTAAKAVAGEFVRAA